MSEGDDGEKQLVSLKVLYTLHGVASQKFVVKPSNQVEARVLDSSELGVVSLTPCLEAIRHYSPDYADICDSSANDYAIYSVDYAEEGLPLQGHGRVSDHVLREVTGKLLPSKLQTTQLELQIHLLPIRVPQDLPFDVPPEQFNFIKNQELLSSHMSENTSHTNNSDVLQDKGGKSQSSKLGSKDMFSFPPPPTSLNFGMQYSRMPSMPAMPSVSLMPPMPTLPGSLQTPRSDTFLPSSPPVRAKPNKISSSTGTVAPKRINPMSDAIPAKHSPSESASVGPKKKKQSSPGASSSEAACGNCGVATASTWRRVHLTAGDILLCNACGLYYKTKNVMRPSFLWDRSSRLANRIQEPPVTKPPPTKSIAKRTSPTNSESASFASSIDPTPHTLSSQEPTDTSSSPESGSQTERNAFELPLHVENPESLKLDDIDEPQHPLQVHLPQTPTTPTRSTRSNVEDEDSQPVPSSIEKLFFVTPDGKKTINIHLPGSGSAGKWLNRMMNPAEESSYFESFLGSPTPKKNRSLFHTSDSPICSSPPTSSNLFSEIPDWSVFPTSPTPPKTIAWSACEKQGAADRKHREHINSPEAI